MCLFRGANGIELRNAAFNKSGKIDDLEGSLFSSDDFQTPSVTSGLSSELTALPERLHTLSPGAPIAGEHLVWSNIKSRSDLRLVKLLDNY